MRTRAAGAAVKLTTTTTMVNEFIHVFELPVRYTQYGGVWYRYLKSVGSLVQDFFDVGIERRILRYRVMYTL